MARLRSGRSPVKPDDAVYLTHTVAWPGDRYAVDRSLAGARQRLHPSPVTAAPPCKQKRPRSPQRPGAFLS
ncbi:hypothetical protein EMIT0P201_10053 [Pseudomonas chlororaphis]